LLEKKALYSLEHFMRIKSIQVRNFRLLANVSINLEDDITLVVGKNNTGKTSLLEAIKIFTSGEEKLSFEDFAQASYIIFKELFEIFKKSIDPATTEDEKEVLEAEILEKFPKIQVQIEFSYDKKKDSLIELSEFITDLDDNRNDACALLSYEPVDSLGLLKSFHNREDQKVEILQYFKENLQARYKLRCYAYDVESGFKREIELGFKEKLKKVVSFEDIKAMRILDDKKGDSNKTLAYGFSKYYNERDKTDANVGKIETALAEISIDLRDKYNEVLKSILNDLKNFGASTPVSIPAITIESEFDSEAVIRNNIKYYYQQDEINLPESYNGLGYSNLIYMVLELASFIERFKNAKEEKVSEFLTVLIEEPEAHMHPQMQQIFISQIKGVLKKAEEANIFVQLIITSHSSHILSEAGIDAEKGFNRIRYFNRTKDLVTVKDFNDLKISNKKKTARFLKQYLTLHKSDLFFSDKVIMVEGTTERMLMPQMIKKAAPALTTEYITILEVGGAFTHKFKEILQFLKLKTLVITDIDAVDAVKGKRCPVNKGIAGELTSNETLKQWLPEKKTIKELLACTVEQKIKEETIRVAFQIEENNVVGRSFEEAFIQCNESLIESSKEVKGKTKNAKNQFSLFRNKKLEKIKGQTAYKLAPKSSSGKTNFAFDVMSFPEKNYGDWEVPSYIKEGLEWLIDPPEKTTKPLVKSKAVSKPKVDEK
jgi:putative ATP-dependent endonuclease of OLD family